MEVPKALTFEQGNPITVYALIVPQAQFLCVL
jgi:hypothetical protein